MSQRRKERSFLDVPTMDSLTLSEICEERQGFSTPELNDTLNLQHVGFREIGDLSAYRNVKALFLQYNRIRSIRGMDALPNLLNLYLESNMIEKIEGLSPLSNLVTLDLSHNRIKELSGLASANLQNLTSLKLAGNELKSVDGILHCPNLTLLDVRRNSIDGEVLDTLRQLPRLKILYANGNPVVSTTRLWRRNAVLQLGCLTFLDDRPVASDERQLVEAWGRGGFDAEKKERELIAQQKRDDETAKFNLWMQRRKERKEARRVAALEVKTGDGNEQVQWTESLDNVLIAQAHVCLFHWGRVSRALEAVSGAEMRAEECRLRYFELEMGKGRDVACDPLDVLWDLPLRSETLQ